MAIIKRVHKKNGSNQIRYQAQVYVKGRRVNYKTFESKLQAEKWHDREKNFLSGDPSKLKKKSTSYVFSDCIQIFSKEAIPCLQKPTQQSYKSAMRHFIDSPLYYVKMKYFNAHHIHVWIEWLKKHPTANTHSRKSFKFELKLLAIILNWYKNFVNEDFNIPITKQHHKLCYYKTIPSRYPDYFIRPESARKWLKWIKENRKNPVYWRIAVFMLLTGVRICEACAMKWDAVNLKEGTARVMRIVRWDFHTRKPELVETTKTKNSNRFLILPDDLIKVLKDMKSESSNTDFLFKGDTGKILNYATVQKVFNKGFCSLNLPWRSTHILRHSYATMALLATRDLISVQASLGHKSIRITERYAKAAALLTKDTAQKTSQIFDLLRAASLQDKF